MSILYAVISQGKNILCEYSNCNGNFKEFTKAVIDQINLADHKCSYSHGNYCIHYIYSEKLIYMCITEDDFDRPHAFLLLSEIKKKFLTAHGTPTASPYVIKPDFYRVLIVEIKTCYESIEKVSIMNVNEKFDKLQKFKLKHGEGLKNHVDASSQTVRVVVMERNDINRNTRVVANLIILLILIVMYIITLPN